MEQKRAKRSAQSLGRCGRRRADNRISSKRPPNGTLLRANKPEGHGRVTSRWRNHPVPSVTKQKFSYPPCAHQQQNSERRSPLSHAPSENQLTHESRTHARQNRAISMPRDPRPPAVGPNTEHKRATTLQPGPIRHQPAVMHQKAAFPEFSISTDSEHTMYN